MKNKLIHKHHVSLWGMLFHKPLLYLFLLFFLPFLIWGTRQTQKVTSMGKSNVSMNLKPQQVSGLSQSKIGVFYLGVTAEGRKIAMAGPRVIKVMDPHQSPEMMQLVRDYKRAYPDGTVIMRVYEGDARGYGTGDNPENSAQDYWQNVLAPAVRSLSSNDRKLIDYVAGPNEFNNTPPIKSASDADWTGRFWAKLAQLISEGGMKPEIGEIPVGNPEPELMGGLAPGIQKAKELGGIWSYHAYTLDYTTDAGQEGWTSLRYRMLNDSLGGSSTNMILTEGGVDKAGNGQTDGWKARGDAATFENWLTWYDSELQKDPYILGVTLFQSGNNSDWGSFNVDLISDWLANYLGGRPQEVAPTTLPPEPTTPPRLTIPPIITTQPLPIPTSIAIPTSIPPTAIMNPQPTTYNPQPTVYQPIIIPPTTIPPTPTITPTPTPPFFTKIKSNFDDFITSIIKFTKTILP